MAQEFPLASLMSPPARQIASAMTFVCATDGNHGRSIAAGARLLGARAVILVHAGVSEQRIQAIRDLGATILRVPGDYDDSVAEARKVASEKGWSLVADPPIRSGESGAAGLGGLLALREDPRAFAALGLGPAARVLLFNTEGATDSLDRSPSR